MNPNNARLTAPERISSTRSMRHGYIVRTVAEEFCCPVCGKPVQRGDTAWQADDERCFCSSHCGGAMSTWQPDIFGKGSRSVAEQPELFPADLGAKPKPVVVEPPDPDQLDLFSEEN